MGWRPGLERMRALCAELGEPQRSFESLHVVGTNGKTSVTLIAAALLQRRGRLCGACISPHARRWSERTRIGGTEIDSEAFAAAAAEVAAAVPRVETALGREERITQFEAAIAISFAAFRRAGVEVAVIEAGLGGRLDATNVIPSRGTALTSVSLDHTEWLGSTEEEIATEKLAVLRPGTVLVTGSLSGPIAELAATCARDRQAELREAGDPGTDVLGAEIAPYLRRNAGVALELARCLEPGLDIGELGPARAAAGLSGRAEPVPGSPPLLLDVAHNPEGAAALAEALAARGEEPAFACIALLDDKDSEGIAAVLAPVLASVVCTAAEPGEGMGRPGTGSRDPAALAAVFAAAGCEAEVEPDPARAVGRALELADAAGGLAVCTGSHYLLRHAWTARRAQSSSR